MIVPLLVGAAVAVFIGLWVRAQIVENRRVERYKRAKESGAPVCDLCFGSGFNGACEDCGGTGLIGPSEGTK